MIEYRWQGIDQYGVSKKGVSFALSQESLEQQLKFDGIALLECKEPFFKRLFNINILKKTKIDLIEKALFFQHVGTLLEHGIPIVKALKSAAHQAGAVNFKSIIIEIISDVEKGKKFSSSFCSHFPQEALKFSILLENAETTGSLGSVCKQIGNNIESIQSIKQSIRRAIATPALTAVFALIVTMAIILFVVPHFEELFRSSKTAIPTITQNLFVFSAWIKSQFGLVFLVGFSLGFIFIVRINKLRMLVKKIINFLLPSIPIFNHIFFDYIALSFLQTVSLYVNAGLPLIVGIDKAQEIISNLVAYSSFEKTIATRVMDGISLEKALYEFKIQFCSPIIISLIGIGEQTGNLGKMLDKAICLQENQLYKRLETATTLVGPIFTIILGLFIAGLLIAIYLPIFGLAQFSSL